jgi:predicted TIM-barrel fold metal-dependent hydrolase
VEYVKRLASIGITESYGQDLPKWNAKTSLNFMKKLGIQTAILSVSTPGVYFQNYKDNKFSRELARFCNEYITEVKQNYPGRFGGFATIPLLDIQSALEELRYALDELKLDGVCLLTNYEGKYLGDKAFEKFFDELHRRKVVVYIHPTDPVGVYDPKLEIANSLIEAPFETTRAVANLIHTATVDRYQDVKYILSHGGGTVPYLAWRIALIKYSRKEDSPSLLRKIYDIAIQGGPVSGLKILKNMYYDTALTASPYALRTMQEFVGPSQIVYGSDLPFAEKVVPMVNKDLRKYPGFSEEDFKAIDYNNCLELFPQFKS